MQYLNVLDYITIAVYFVVIIGVGFYFKRLASQSLENYFLGGRNLPWWALGLSGMAAWLDMTGTMMIVSFLYLMGPRGLFIELRGGVGLVLVFLLIWIGKWHRRSGVITNAEWMSFRFGEDFWGNFARVSQVIAQVIFSVGMLAYAFKGIGLFLSMFLPFSPLTCALFVLAITTFYTLLSGFYGVVVTDIFQSVCIFGGVGFVVFFAVSKIIGTDFAALAVEVTGNQNWMSSSLSYKTEMPKGYEEYSFLTFIVGFYLLKTIVQGIGSPGDSKYFGARNDRECGLLSMMSGFTLMMRWPLMIAFAVLGIFLVKDMFPDQSVLNEATVLVKQHVGDVQQNEWVSAISGIANDPGKYDPSLASGLESLFGDNWKEKINLLGYNGTVNPERIVPAVLLYVIPKGIRGLILVALLAAAMSTLSININMTTGFLTRDIYQNFFRKKASNKELIYISYAFTLLIVISAVFLAYSTKNINDIWGWLMMGLSGGMIIPFAMRLYWWRFNGSGFAIGMLSGIIGAVVQRIFLPGLTEVKQLAFTVTLGIIGSIVGTFLTPMTCKKVLKIFYIKTRPFGLWKPMKRGLPADFIEPMNKEHKNDILAVPFVGLTQITIFLLPMQLLIGTYRAFWCTFPIFVVAIFGSYWFWYRNLPSDEYDAIMQEKVDNLLNEDK